MLVAVAAVRLRLLDLPLERDEGGYAYFGRLILEGIPPFAGAYDTKLPGIYYAYASMMALFGDTPRGIHTGLLLVNLLTMVFLFLLGRRLVGEGAGLFSGLSFGVLASSPWALGLWAHLEHFLVAAATAGLALVSCGRQRRGEVFAGGLCLGFALVTKHPALAFVLLGLVALLLGLPSRAAEGRPTMLWRLGPYCGGVLVAPALVAAILAASGVWEKFVVWSFKYPAYHVSTNTLDIGLELLRHRFGRIAAANPVACGLALFGLLPPLWLVHWRRIWCFTWLFFLLSFLAVSPGLFFRPQYFLLWFPALSLACALGFEGLRRLCARAGGTWSERAASCLMVAGVAFFPLLHDWRFFFTMDSFEASRAVYQSNPFPESVVIGKFLRERAGLEDRIAVLGSEPQIYLYAARRSATPYIFTYALMEEHPWALAMQQEMIRSIEQAKPRYLVSVNMVSSWLPRPSSHDLIFRWARAYVSRHYEQVGLVQIPPQGLPNFVWEEQAARFLLRTPGRDEFVRPSISVFRRRGPAAQARREG